VEGKLIIFTAPSGAGKTTLVHNLLKIVDNLLFSVSATTRKRRENEVDGKDYHFITAQEFKEKLAKGDFLEWQEVYDGNYYGTLKSEIDRILCMGKNVIFDVDVKGATNIKKHYGDQALTVFVRPPSVAALRKRLIGRKSETDASLEKRIQKAALELSYESRFDTFVLNDDLAIATQCAYELVTEFLSTSNPLSQKSPQVKIDFGNR